MQPKNKDSNCPVRIWTVTAHKSQWKTVAASSFYLSPTQNRQDVTRAIFHAMHLPELLSTQLISPLGSILATLFFIVHSHGKQ